MDIVYIILIVITVLFFIFLFFDVTHNKLKDYIIRINKVEEKIDVLLNNKLDNILKIDSIIKDKIKTDKEIIEDIASLKEIKENKTKLDNELNNALTKIEYIKEQYNELDNETELNNLFEDIKKDKEELNAYKKYYNDNVNDYNRLTSKFPYVITAKLFKYKSREFLEDTKE